MEKSKILVYPCGTEIGLEIYKAINDDKKYLLFGGSSTYDHGRFVYENHIDNLPFITDSSDSEMIEEFNRAIEPYGIDFIYPAMDGVVTAFAKHRDRLSACLIAPDFATCEITRSKKKTYAALSGAVKTPETYEEDSIPGFPVFVKPDVGQGSAGAKLIKNSEELKEYFSVRKAEDTVICEYLPGEECTVDCFTNSDGKLIFSMPRKRRRIKNGIAVNTYNVDLPKAKLIAEAINSKIRQKGGWFFQIRQDKNGEWTLLEVASRVAGSSGCARFLGVDLPLLTVNEYAGIVADDVLPQGYSVEIDRALDNCCRTDLEYGSVYVDYDDTLILDGSRVNTKLIGFLYKCLNEGKKIYLLTRHDGDLEKELSHFRLEGLFDSVIHIGRQDSKTEHITGDRPIYIDDSYGERKKVFETLGIPVFDIHNFECLL